MSKIATNRTNIKYAHELKRRGFPTAVHALPKDIKSYVDELLEKGWQIRTIANELNKRYALEIEAAGLKPITRTSLTTYRDKFWHKTPQFRKIVIEGTEATKKAAVGVLKNFDAFKEMVGAAKYQKERMEMIKEMPIKIPTKRGDEVVLQYFEMCEKILEKALDLGLLQRAPVRVESKIEGKLGLTDGLTDSELIAKTKEAIDAIEGKGKYAKREYTGEKPRIRGISSKAGG